MNMPKEGARAIHSPAIIMSMRPDICWTPMGKSMVPVAYPVVAYLDDTDINTSPNVRYTGKRAHKFVSSVSRTYGDEAGTGGGVISGTTGGICEPKTYSKTVRVNGAYAIRDQDEWWMNNRNTVGKLYYQLDTSKPNGATSYGEQRSFIADQPGLAAPNSPPWMANAGKGLQLALSGTPIGQIAPIVGPIVQDHIPSFEEIKDWITRENVRIVHSPCPALAEELAKTQKAIEMGKLADATYHDGPLPEGYRRANEQDLRDLGLLSENGNDLTKISDSDFHSEVFVKTDPLTGDDSYVIGFKGTNPTSVEDWKNNLGQGAGLNMEYYDRAIEIGKTAQLYQPGNFEIVGHSLGGGMAAGAHGASGAPTWTYNAAGVHRNTLIRVPYENAANVQAYRVEGEVLTWAQEDGPTALTMPNAYGTKTDIAPTSAPPKASLLDPLYDHVITAGERLMWRVKQHAMVDGDGGMLPALEKRKKEIIEKQEANGCV